MHRFGDMAEHAQRQLATCNPRSEIDVYLFQKVNFKNSSLDALLSEDEDVETLLQRF